MKTLKQKISRSGSFYDLINRIGDIAMYSMSYTPLGETIGFDVFVVRKDKERVLNGKILSGGERFAKNNEYGVSAFSFSTLERAEKKFGEMVNKAKLKGAER